VLVLKADETLFVVRSVVDEVIFVELCLQVPLRFIVVAELFLSGSHLSRDNRLDVGASLVGKAVWMMHEELML